MLQFLLYLLFKQVDIFLEIHLYNHISFGNVKDVETTVSAKLMDKQSTLKILKFLVSTIINTTKYWIAEMSESRILASASKQATTATAVNAYFDAVCFYSRYLALYALIKGPICLNMKRNEVGNDSLYLTLTVCSFFYTRMKDRE